MTIEISEHGNLLMYKSSYSAKTVKDIIESRNLNGLRIFDYWDVLPSLDFLREFTFLKRLEVTCWNDQDYSFLRDMPQLEHLSIGPSYPMENPIDLSSQIKVKDLALQWRKNRITGLEVCENVEDICLIEFKNADLHVIRNLTKITRFRIKTGSMKTLDGIENLNELEMLEVGNCRSLRSISALTGLVRLQSIRIESCRKIQDIDSLSNLPSLSVLQFVNCGKIPKLDYHERFPKLTKLDLLARTKFREKPSDYKGPRE